MSSPPLQIHSKPPEPAVTFMQQRVTGDGGGSGAKDGAFTFAAVFSMGRPSGSPARDFKHAH